jgi:hypothetical protein
MTYNVFIPLSKTSFVLFPLILLGQVQEKNLAYDELYNLCSDNDNDRAKQIEYANTYLMKAKGE